MDISAPLTSWATHTTFMTTLAQEANPTGVLGAPSSTTAPGAQPLGTTGEPGATGVAPAPTTNLFFIMILMMAGVLVLTAFSGRKERKKHANLLASIGKKDKVRAAGGIIGTIVEIKNDEVLLETDRASNTRIRVARSSISSVIESKSDQTKDQSKDESPETAETK